MKRFKLLVCLGIALCLSGGQSLFSQNKKGQKKQEILSQIERGQYTFNVSRALPLGGKTVHLSSSYSLEVRNDSVYSYLPYFGRAYNIPYGGGDGLRFEEAVSDYSIMYDKKGTAHIKFNARTKEDRYTFNIRVFTNGSATVNVIPVNRQSISFSGDINPE